jgi:hypothetical protein
MASFFEQDLMKESFHLGSLLEAHCALALATMALSVGREATYVIIANNLQRLSPWVSVSPCEPISRWPF